MWKYRNEFSASKWKIEAYIIFLKNIEKEINNSFKTEPYMLLTNGHLILISHH